MELKERAEWERELEELLKPGIHYMELKEYCEPPPPWGHYVSGIHYMELKDIVEPLLGALAKAKESITWS